MAKRTPVRFDDEIFLVNGTYYFRGFIEGSDQRKEVSLKLKEGALQRDVLAAKKAIKDQLQRVNARDVRATVRSLAPLYLKSRVDEASNPEHLSASSLYESKHIMNDYLVPYFGATRVSDLTQKRFEEYCLSKEVKDLNKVNHRKVLNHFMKWCLHEEIIGVRVAFEIPKKARKARKQITLPTNEEFSKMLETATNNLLLYIAMYGLQGMRNMEILRLKVSACDMDRREIWIDGKTNRTRTDRSIPMNDFVYQLLRIRLASLKSEYVFPNQRNKSGKTPYTQSMNKVFKAHLTKNGINPAITPHNLRAFFETHMHLNTKFTDTQREKMAGAKADVQKKHYVRMQAQALKGLESAVQIPGLEKVFEGKISTDLQIPGGKRGGNLTKSHRARSVSKRKKERK